MDPDIVTVSGEDDDDEDDDDTCSAMALSD